MSRRPRHNQQSFVDLTEDDDNDDDDDHVKPAAKKPRGCEHNPVTLDDDSDDSSSVEVLVVANTQDDAKLAAQLSAQWSEEDGNRKQLQLKSEQAMMASIPGKAVTMVHKIIQLVQKTKTKYPQFQTAVETIGTDDMVFLAEKLLQTQQTFATEGIPTHADLGYHYTQPTCLDSIRENGLLSKAERDANGVKVHFNGSAMGDGIYTANNPFHSMNDRYGDAGLMVVRLIGKPVHYHEQMMRQLIGIGGPPFHNNNNNHHSQAPSGNTYSTSPTDPHQYQCVNVLKTSGQCLPMVKFLASKVLKEPVSQARLHRPGLAYSTAQPLGGTGVAQLAMAQMIIPQRFGRRPVLGSITGAAQVAPLAMAQMATPQRFGPRPVLGSITGAGPTFGGGGPIPGSGGPLFGGGGLVPTAHGLGPVVGTGSMTMFGGNPRRGRAFQTMSGGGGGMYTTGYNKDDNEGVACLMELHEGLQEILDEYLNSGKPTSFTVHDMLGQVVHQSLGAKHTVGRA